MKLTHADIDRYGPLTNCHPPCQDGVTVLSGPNEAGKTLYLEALLKLLEPDIESIMEPGPRLDTDPTGRVVVEHANERYECDGSTSLCDISAIEPAHLQSVFVVRDTDLQLPDDQEYYTSLIDTLGDIHTEEIHTITDALKDRGRLTDARLNVSSDQAYDNAGTVRDQAETLAEELRAYRSTIDEEGLDALLADRLRTRRALREARDERDQQERAKVAAEYDHLASQLDSYRSATEELARLDEYDSKTLDTLQSLDDEITRARDELADIAEEIDETERELTDREEDLATVEQRIGEFERREQAVEDTRTALDQYRSDQTESAGLERTLAIARPGTLAAILAAGLVGAAGAATGLSAAIGLAVLFVLVAVASGYVYYRANEQQTSLEIARESVLQQARDAGFTVDSVEAVAPAIEYFENNYEGVKQRRTQTNTEIDGLESTLSSLRQEHSDLSETIDEQVAKRDELLAEAAVERIDAYESRVEKRADLEPERRTARQSLVDRFGDPDATEPPEQAAAWESDLEEMVADIDLGEINPDLYDEKKLASLTSEIDSLEAELDDLESTLERHDNTLDEFDTRARDLQSEPFIGSGLGLESRTPAGLDALASDLDELVESIETDAELSRKAIELFERIEETEAEKLTTLFDPEGPASKTFARLTGGRYSSVSYDPAEHSIVVEKRNGETLAPSELSQGTTDQLYFASRVSLARQLLGNSPGFLLLDDPFLAADPTRLRAGFETLQELGDEGWQILYLTAKQEVYDQMVSTFDLAHMELEPLTLGP